MDFRTRPPGAFPPRAACFPYPMTTSLTDARGRRIALPAPPQRIVSLVPSQTELLADLGLDDEVVGLTRFCVHPAGWKDRKQIVGGTKNVSLERVRALAPDLILANLEENTRADVEALDALAPVFVTRVETIPEALDMIQTVGILTRRTERAGALVEQLEAGFGRQPSAVPAVRVAYLIWRRPYMTIGRDTFIHAVLAHAGLVNAFEAQRRYPEVTPAELAGASPDVVLLSSEPFPFTEKHVGEVEALLPGTPVLLVDGERLSWYGSRLLRTPPYLAALRTTVDAALGAGG
jgi:ABC-type Fe3+-hydroxamate transport system substrate-binding protein